MLKRIGTAARLELEAFFGIKVYLESRVQVRHGWRKDDRALCASSASSSRPDVALGRSAAVVIGSFPWARAIAW